MTQLNLNSEAKILLNERGLAKTEEYLQQERNNPNSTESTKEAVVKLWRSRIDEEGYLTAPLNEIMGKYSSYDFENQVVTITNIADDLQEQFNLNCLVTVLLNERGLARTEEYLQKVNSTNSTKEAIEELWRSRIDEEGYLTAPLNEIITMYDEKNLANQIAVVDELSYNDLADTLGKSR